MVSMDRNKLEAHIYETVRARYMLATLKKCIRVRASTRRS